MRNCCAAVVSDKPSYRSLRLAWAIQFGAHSLQHRPLGSCPMPVLYCCRAVLPLGGQDPRLQTFIGTDMLRGSLAALSTTRSTAGSHQGDVLGLIRDILVQQLATQPGPRQVSPEKPAWDCNPEMTALLLRDLALPGCG